VQEGAATEVASGGRMIDAILTNTMLPELSIELLNRQMAGEEIQAITVTADGSSGFSYEFRTAGESAAAAVLPLQELLAGEESTAVADAVVAAAELGEAADQAEPLH